MPEYLTSKEVARHLRLNQKKIYALVTSGGLPAARVSGKWLFPRELVDEWVTGHTVNRSGGALRALLDRMLVLQGSDDWLLSRLIERFQRRSGSAIPTAAVGSLAGLSAVAESAAHVASCHVAEAAIRERARVPLYLLALFARDQGLFLAPDATPPTDGLRSLCRRPLRFAERQEGSGTSRLVARLLADEHLQPAWTPVGPFSSHVDVALAVRSGRADAGVGIRMAAELAGVRFVPLAREQFELAIPASLMSHERVGEFLQFLQSELEVEARGSPPGYAFEALGRMRRIGPAA